VSIEYNLNRTLLPRLAAACALCLLAGCTAAHYRKSADKEAYRLIAEKTPLVTNMEPRFTIEQTNTANLSSLRVVSQTNEFLGEAAAAERGARVLTLEHALTVAVKHSRVYQNNKEQLYLSALSLSLSRHQFTPIFSAGGGGTFTEQNVSVEGFEVDPATGELRPVVKEELTRNVRGNGSVGVDWLIRDVGRISAAFTTDFLRFIAGGPGTIVSSQVGGTFTRPLLRNAGFKAEVEALTQAERDLLYALRAFVRFRKDFSVEIASAYYGVLGNRDAARNSFLNLQSSRQAGIRTRALAAEGRTTQSDLGRIEQQELSAEGAWISAVRVYQRALDDFKIRLGIPVETKLVLDDQELKNLTILQPDIQVDDAIKIALAARLDYQNARDQVADTERQVKLAADRLKTQLDFTAGGGFQSVQEDRGFPLPDPNRYRWNAGLDLNLPLERKAERNSYRSAIIAAQRSVRNLEQTRDEIELQVRESWRTLEQARRSYEISELGVKLAERRVEEQELLAELGRVRALDQVDAQNALLSSKDQRTQALVAHTIARIRFWDNMGILYIKDNGQWVEGGAPGPETSGVKSGVQDATGTAKLPANQPGEG
jgi:outer membrane protein TolC